jgi:hypothetical protein
VIVGAVDLPVTVVSMPSSQISTPLGTQGPLRAASPPSAPPSAISSSKRRAGTDPHAAIKTSRLETVAACVSIEAGEAAPRS